MTGSTATAPKNTTRLGIRENAAQFALLVLINGFVGAMVGMERSILPTLAEQEFHQVARVAILSFIAVFGLAKALANIFAGVWADKAGRKRVLVAGWLVSSPVPFLLMWAPSWSWVLAANALLGVSQGLTWSAAVIMKIDLAGPKRRGLAMGLNEAAGYLAVGLSAAATGWVAAEFGLRPEPFMLGVAYIALGLFLSVVSVQDTVNHRALEQANSGHPQLPHSRPAWVFVETTLKNGTLSTYCQAGLVNNLNDGVAWGLFPLIFAASGLSLSEVGALAAIYPAIWGLGQLFTGAWSDRAGRKPLIVSGMGLQALGIVVVGVASSFEGYSLGMMLLGMGTAMVYPTLLAAISDAAKPAWRATAVGVYRWWRDLGYVVGAVVAGVVADAFGPGVAINLIASLTLLSGVLVAFGANEKGPAGVKENQAQAVNSNDGNA
jgi:MFS family permease